MSKKLTFKDIEDRGLLLYKYVRGSTAYGLALPTSDVDEGGVYLEPIETVVDLGLDFQEQINDEKNDTTWYSLRKFMQLLMGGNPNVLEALFVDDKFVLYEHPIMTEIKKHRDMFLTKDSFGPLIGYAKTQIMKARGLNKKIVNPVTERKGVLDFCYTFKNQGSQSMKEFLAEHGLDQKYCGLVNIPNMKDTYGVYYDYAAWLHFELDYEEPYMVYEFSKTLCGDEGEKVYERIKNKDFYGYAGIVHPDGKSNEVRLSSIPKGEKPICFMTYNQDGYTSHCKRYTEYQEWVAKRNPQRYLENKEKDYDRKNVAHSVRLMHMGIELAKEGVFHVDRTNIDRDFILDIRLGNRTYDEVIEYIESKNEEMKQAMESSTLPEHIDVELVNKLLLDIRYGQIRSQFS
jgi:predicted nucleotidyltransferase